MSDLSTFPSITPKPLAEDIQGQDPERNPSLVKRKRSFVALACVACRKRKTKCDGRRPVCGPCEQRHVECAYDFPDDVPAARRGKKAIERLSKANIGLKNVIDTLRSGTEDQALYVLRKVRAAPNLESSLESIANASRSLPLFGSIDQTAHEKEGIRNSEESAGLERLSPQDDSTTFHPGEQVDTEASRAGLQDLAAEQTSPTSNFSDYDLGIASPTLAVRLLPISQWTPVQGEDKHFCELLALLWTWDTTFTRIIDRGVFETDLYNGAFEEEKDSPQRQFCSTFLVNTLLGFACVYITDESTFGQMENPLSRGRLFVEEAERQLPVKISNPSYDLLQGLIMLYAYEVRIGDARKAKSHLEAIFRVYQQLDFDEGEVQKEIEESNMHRSRVFYAKAKIAWGLYIFDWQLSHIYGTQKRLPKPMIRKAWRPEHKFVDASTTPEYWWYQWPKSTSAQRSFYQEVFDAECSLIEVAEDILKHVYANQPEQARATAAPDESLNLIRRLHEWKTRFHEEIPEEGNELPQTLHVLYCYEMLLVVVLRKVAHLTKVELGTNNDPLDLCYAHTNNIMSILWTYRTLYTIRYEYWAIQACALVAFSTIFNLDSDSVLQDSFEKVCRILFELSQVYPIAGDFLFSIRLMIQKHRIRISKTSSKYLFMIDRPHQRELTEQWRAPIVLAKDDGTRGGYADISLGDLIEGFNGIGLES